MDIDITEFFNTACPRDYAASVAEIGFNAGEATWRAANEDSDDYPLLDTEDKLEAFRVMVRSSGGWNDDEVAEFSNQGLNALCIQWVAGDIREAGLGPNPDWKTHEDECQKGLHAGRIYCGSDSKVYFMLDA